MREDGEQNTEVGSQTSANITVHSKVSGNKTKMCGGGNGPSDVACECQDSGDAATRGQQCAIPVPAKHASTVTECRAEQTAVPTPGMCCESVDLGTVVHVESDVGGRMITFMKML
jgi:hypothetical protein